MSFDPSAPASADAGIFGLETSLEQAGIILIPVPFDATTSYRPGTHQGPEAILKASHQVDLYDLENGRAYEAGICMHPIPEHIEQLNAQARKRVDNARHGAVDPQTQQFVNDAGEQVNRWVYEQAKHAIEQKRIVGLVGGDHSTPFGCIQAHAEAYPELGILHIDAHADLRVAYEGFVWSHASIMYNVLQKTNIKRLVQVGIRDFSEDEYDLIRHSKGRVETFFDKTLAQWRFENQSFQQTIRGIVEKLPHHVYVSFDIDGLDPSLCPNTGTPVPGGLQFQEACALLHEIGKSGRRLVGFDLNEVAPDPQGHSEWDGNVGARLLYKMCGYAWHSRNHRPRLTGL